MGLDVHLYRGRHREEQEDVSGGCDYNTDKVELPSARYPEHLFKIGYFRSSYNDVGINTLLRKYGLPTLGDILEAPDAYAFTPDWPSVIARCDLALSSFDAARERMQYVASAFPVFEFDCPDAATALTTFQDEMRKPNDPGDGWSSKRGDFWPDGTQVHALIPGRNSLGHECIYVVRRQTDENLAWYRQALEIVRETAVWVLAQPDPKDFHIHWSS